MTERKHSPNLRRSLGGLVGFGLAGALGILPGAAAGQTVKEIPLPVAGSAPVDIVAGPDESVWFTEQHGDRIGRVSRCGELAEFALPATGNFLRGIAAGPDGNLWFTELVGKIGRITTAGAITEYTIPGGISEPIEIVAGADGNLWFTEYYNRIGRITPAGLVTLFPIPTVSSAPRFITVSSETFSSPRVSMTDSPPSPRRWRARASPSSPRRTTP